MRLREAATRLAAAEPVKILDIALDSGFGDVSNFNRAFRTEFGVSPRGFRGKDATVHEMASRLGAELSAEY
jgi:AraC-like DNA-binding protein